ncbi:50S ribosomal protein L6 [Candidatus Micrarchaeota archaeon]|nr:50S ribosomal protein L6 [Candidatus Micrarchaeota archaeon]
MISVPDGVQVKVDGRTVWAKGPMGEVQKILPKEVAIKLDGKNISVSSLDKSLVGTSEAIVTNVLFGVSSGYKKSFKLLHAHFPISVEVKGKDIVIKNFLGEKQPRKTVVVGNTKVDAKGQNVTLSGPDKEALGQTLANLRTAMRIKDKDGRVFQDGIYEVASE